jgi:hypothetical protein
VAIYDLFSKRQKRLRGDLPDVLVYDALPRTLRIQILTILVEALGDGSTEGFDVWGSVSRALAREYGEFELRGGLEGWYAVRTFFMETSDTERALDLVEMAYRLIDSMGRDELFHRRVDPELDPDTAISELNARFREHGVGYQLENGDVIRVDSTLLHAEVVKPALQLLQDPLYAGANTEFLNAYEHYRHGRNEEALTECLKAFESVMKAICVKRGWAYDEKDTAKKLLEILFQNGLVPAYLQAEFTSLRANLESGVPTVRNKQGGHGRGTKARVVPDYLVSFLLHLTASNILLLVNAEKALG